MENNETALPEKEVLGKNKRTEKSKEHGFVNQSAARLFSRLNLDFSCNYLVQSSPSCRGSAYSFLLREKPLYASALDMAVRQIESPLERSYSRLMGRYSCGLPCDLGLMR